MIGIEDVDERIRDQILDAYGEYPVRMRAVVDGKVVFELDPADVVIQLPQQPNFISPMLDGYGRPAR